MYLLNKVDLGFAKKLIRRVRGAGYKLEGAQKADGMA